MTLLERVTHHLVTHRVACALIGASALARHGVSRSTFDHDLLVLDATVLDTDFWSPLRSAGSVEVRRGDGDDPLRGVVRCRAEGQRDVDIVVGRHAWQADVLARARPVVAGEPPVVEAADLVLLKLDAGGSQDRWDIEQLLASDDDGRLRSVVAQRVGVLPAAAREIWTLLERERGRR